MSIEKLAACLSIGVSLLGVSLPAPGVEPLPERARKLSCNQEFAAAPLGAEPELNATDERGDTALYQCVAAANAEAVRNLLRAGADPNAGTPAIFAVRHSEVATRLAMATALLEAGADPNVRRQFPDQTYGETPLMHEVTVGNPDMVRLLLKHGADVTIGYYPDRGMVDSPLEAVFAGRDSAYDHSTDPRKWGARPEEVADLLFEAGAGNSFQRMLWRLGLDPWIPHHLGILALRSAFWLLVFGPGWIPALAGLIYLFRYGLRPALRERGPAFALAWAIMIAVTPAVYWYEMNAAGKVGEMGAAVAFWIAAVVFAATTWTLAAVALGLAWLVRRLTQNRA